jgi:hypothetical protein
MMPRATATVQLKRHMRDTDTKIETKAKIEKNCKEEVTFASG